MSDIILQAVLPMGAEVEHLQVTSHFCCCCKLFNVAFLKLLKVSDERLPYPFSLSLNSFPLKSKQFSPLWEGLKGYCIMLTGRHDLSTPLLVTCMVL